MSTTTKTTVQNTLEQEILVKLKQLDLGLPPGTLQTISKKLAQEQTPTLVNNVNATSNKQIDVISSNLIGVNNPVDLNNSNLNDRNLADTLNVGVQQQVTPVQAQTLTNSLETVLRTTLTPGQKNKINFNQVLSSFSNNIPSSINKAVSTAVQGFAQGVYTNNLNTPLTISSISNSFETLPSDEALSQITDEFNISTAGKYLTQAEQFNVKNQDNIQKLENTSKGFVDPNANYPTKQYAGQAETNKLSQGAINGTVVQEKNKSRMLGAKLPNGNAWDQPESPFKGEYPYNKVTETESGHVIEIDDTPGSERLHVYHKSGTFIEIDSNGSVVKRSVGSSYEIIDKNGKISISGQADISINGACNIYVGNDANIEVDGDTNLICHNDITAQAGGTFNLSSVEEFNITSSNVNIEAYNSLNLKSNVDLSLHSGSNFNINSNTNIFAQTTNYYQNATTFYHQTETNYDKHVSYYNESDNMYVKNNEGYYVESGEQHYKVTGDWNLDAAGIAYAQSGTASSSRSSQGSKTANIADYSKIGILSGRKDIIRVEITDPIGVNYADKYAIELEEETNEQQYEIHRNKIITSGLATSADFDRVPVVIDSDIKTKSVVSVQNKIISGDERLAREKELPGNFFLTPNFTLESVTTKTALSKYNILGTEEIPYGAVVFNLQELALNILEPLYNTYPNIIVTSCYRTPESSSPNSQHILGKAVDIQFKGVSKDDYFELAQKVALFLNYDQLILEYASYTNNPWLHISFNGATNRKQTLTFWNNRKYDNGLFKLA